LARGPALFGFTIELLRNAGWPAHLTERDGVELEAILAARHAQAIAHSHQLGRLATRAVDLDLAAFDRLAGEGSRLEEARRPQPDVEADARGADGSEHGFHVRMIAHACIDRMKHPRLLTEPGQPGASGARCARRSRRRPAGQGHPSAPRARAV